MHTDGKFDFNVSSGGILNLFSREYHYLHFPGADEVNQEREKAKVAMSTLCAAFKPPKNTAHRAIMCWVPISPFSSAWPRQ